MSSKVVIFSCNWNGWSGIESAASSGLRYPTSLKVVRVTCLSRIHAGLILKAFELGADGVMLLGCQPGSCNFDFDNDHITKEYEKAQDVLALLGTWKSRLSLTQLPAFDGQQFVEQATKFLAEIEQMTVSDCLRCDDSKLARDSEIQPKSGEEDR